MGGKADGKADGKDRPVPSDDSDFDQDECCDIKRSSEKPFLCGVVEGFYGRPWNSAQRIELFSWLKEFGMTTYLYAPKDDVKHRAYWRELYTVDEADNLTELIQAAHKNDVQFVYAISPGLDITYSNQKDLATLRRKLDQVAAFGCKSFALLFDDIEPEMNKADKEVFQSFAHAQASVTNTIYEHLKEPAFMFCPTEYCATRAVPTVLASEYLSTIGSKLHPDIEVMWTGPKVVSMKITLSSIKQLIRVLRRPPLIWDNIHANDYDQRRVFLGPFSGRDPAIIPYLAGVLTNPNCEFEPNWIALQTLAVWSKAKIWNSVSLPESPQSVVEREEIDIGESSIQSDYEAREALRLAVSSWLPQLYKSVDCNGLRAGFRTSLAPCPDATLTGVPSSVSTCMTVTPTTQSGTGIPLLVNEICNEAGEPMDVLVDRKDGTVLPPPRPDLPNSLVNISGSAEMLPSAAADSPAPSDQMSVDESTVDGPLSEDEKLTADELLLICDMFYLPYEHGSRALHLISEFKWLKSHSHLLKDQRRGNSSPEVEQWCDRAKAFEELVNEFGGIVDKFSKIPNRSLLYDLGSYLWDLRGNMKLLNTFIRWLGSNHNSVNTVFGMTDPEPWVFRGGLTGELQRLLPLDKSSDLFSHQLLSDAQHSAIYTIRPYLPTDEAAVYEVCSEVNSHLSKDDSLAGHQQLVPDLLVGGLLTVSSQYCFVVEDGQGLCGYALASPDARDFHNKMAVSWLPEMQGKYPAPIETDHLTPAQELMMELHHPCPETSEALLSSNPALVHLGMLNRVKDFGVKQRLLACVFSTLRSAGASGAHCQVDNEQSHSTMYRLLGFISADPAILTRANPRTALMVRSI